MNLFRFTLRQYSKLHFGLICRAAKRKLIDMKTKLIASRI